MRVAAKECSEGGCRATLPFAGSASKHGAKAIAAARDSEAIVLSQTLTHQQWLGEQMTLFGEVMLACAIFLDALRFASFQRHVAILGFEVHVMFQR